MSGRILVADDEKTIREAFVDMFQDEGFAVDVASDGEEAIQKVRAGSYDLLITDLKMPRADGMEALKATKEISPETGVMIVTAYATVDNAVEAMKAGADDYVLKPFIFEEVILKVRRILERRKLTEANAGLIKEIEEKQGKLVCASGEMEKVCGLVEKVAPAGSNVLIIGESGTGKEVVAREIHSRSGRRGRFVPVNCAAIQQNLFESELFGYRKGAFTGAHKNRRGLFALADGGTLFLDEVESMPLDLQAKLLRAIEEKQILPVGSEDYEKTDARILAATNRDLEAEVEEGRFRGDLFFRLNVFAIQLPPLRARKEAIPELTAHFMARLNRELKKSVREIAPEALEALVAAPWKGNVRELQNAIERAMILCDEDVLTMDHFQLLSQGSGGPETANLKENLKRFERSHILSVLRSRGGDKEGAAEALGVSVSSLYRKIEELEISPNEIPKPEKNCR